MALQISPKPFTSSAEDWDWNMLGPAWVKVDKGGATFDRQVCAGIRSFVASALAMEEREVTHGTVYAARLDGRAVAEGLWHYDLGEYREDAPTRYVGTWASDSVMIQNMFWIPGEAIGIVPPNGYVVAFSEGTDRHKRRYTPERPDAVGLFVSLALYADDEPANLHCPRLASLRDGSRRAIQAQAHAPVMRTVY